MQKIYFCYTPDIRKDDGTLWNEEAVKYSILGRGVRNAWMSNAKQFLSELKGKKGVAE